ncbi:MarR family winged helix-turn-helix transcriptional regulator [Candidatus Solincola sp.]|jgi:DNA-binding MarR family transcriptional regulator|nr:MarR family transcriptional regulator [Actinomycetota bacterium]MDI7252179.1 MarR family transcriptional regulator [Actinomycetota bacterium]
MGKVQRVAADVSPPRLEEHILNASRIMVNILAESLLQEGEEQITVPQFRVLDMVYNLNDKPARIAVMLGISPSAVTSLLERLEEKGLLRRRPGTDDRRRVELALTQRGEHLVRQVNARRKRHLERILEEMNPTARRHLEESLREFVSAYLRTKEEA